MNQQTLNQLKQIANQLDDLNLYKQADQIDQILIKLAQQVDQPTENSESTESISLISTSYQMFKSLHDFFRDNLKKLDYLGDDKIDVIVSAFDQFMSMFKVVIDNQISDFDKQQVDSYNNHLRKIEKEVERSSKMKVTPTKVKVDKFLFFDELQVLLNKLERSYNLNKQFEDFNIVLKKGRVLKNAFSNVLESVSEQVANTDLIDN